MITANKNLPIMQNLCTVYQLENIVASDEVLDSNNSVVLNRRIIGHILLN